MLHGFTEDKGERNRSVICTVCIISFFEGEQTCSFFQSVGTVPLSRENGTTGEVSWLNRFQAICTLKYA